MAGTKWLLMESLQRDPEHMALLDAIHSACTEQGVMSGAHCWAFSGVQTINLGLFNDSGDAAAEVRNPVPRLLLIRIGVSYFFIQPQSRMAQAHA